MAADDPLSAVDPRAVPPVTRRSELKLAAAINVLAGGWLVVAPSVLAYAPGDPALPDRLVGFVVAAIGLARLAGFLRASPIGWVAAALGGWLTALGRAARQLGRRSLERGGHRRGRSHRRHGRGGGQCAPAPVAALVIVAARQRTDAKAAGTDGPGKHPPCVFSSCSPSSPPSYSPPAAVTRR